MKDGIDYDDDDFLERISKICNIITLNSDKHMGFHLKHESFFNERTNILLLRNINYRIFQNNKKNNIIYFNPSINIKVKIKKFNFD